MHLNPGVEYTRTRMKCDVIRNRNEANMMMTMKYLVVYAVLNMYKRNKGQRSFHPTTTTTNRISWIISYETIDKSSFHVCIN